MALCQELGGQLECEFLVELASSFTSYRYCYGARSVKWKGCEMGRESGGEEAR